MPKILIVADERLGLLPLDKVKAEHGDDVIIITISEAIDKKIINQTDGEFMKKMQLKLPAPPVPAKIITDLSMPTTRRERRRNKK